MRSVPLVVASLLGGCHPGQAAGTSHASSSSTAAVREVEDGAGALRFLARRELARGAGVVVESVRYPSGPLGIAGQVCRPDDASRHPLILVNHGGFDGNGDEAFEGDLSADTLCLDGARRGYVVAESSYRGEDGSDGEIEVCLGEVDDVIALLRILRGQSYVDASRVGAFGGSHGGCITTALALREPTLRAAVDYFGPSDLAKLTAWWHAQLDQDEPLPFCAPPGAASGCRAIHERLIRIVETAVGGPPSASTMAAYRARSPVFGLSSLAVPMMFVQGADDPAVGLEQACLKRAALTAGGHPPLAWYLDRNLAPASPGHVCGGGYRMDPVPDAKPAGAWTADGPFFFVYEGQGHIMTGPAAIRSADAAMTFLRSHL